MTSTDVNTRPKQENIFAISGPVIRGPDGFIDTDNMDHDLVNMIEWILSQDLGPDAIPVAVCTAEAIAAVDQERVLAVMNKYHPRQLKTVA